MSKKERKASKKKQKNQERHQRAAGKRKAEQKKRVREEEQATKFVRPESGAKRKKLVLKDKVSDSPASSEKPKQKVVPVTEKTEEELLKWANNMSKVGATNTVTTRRHESPRLIATVFSLMEYKQGHPSTLITFNALQEEVYGLTPHNKGHEPQEDIRYLCKEPLPEQKPLFYIKDRPVYTVRVYPVIVKNFSEKIISLETEDSEFAITEELLMQTGKDLILYTEDGESKYIWIRNPEYIGSIEAVLQRAEKEDKGTSNPWIKDEENLLRAPVYALRPAKAMEIIAQVIQRKEEISPKTS